MGFHKTLKHPPTRALSPVIPPNAWHLCITAAAGTELAVPSSGAPQNLVTPDRSLHPEGLNLHAASLRHTCVHCGRFVTAAPRRSLGSVSVPMWLAVLSDQLRVVALVSRYLTNKLIRNRLLPECIAALSTSPCGVVVSSGITCPFGQLSLAPGYISDSLLTRPPLMYCYIRSTCMS